jgi:hypothetical protein
MMAMAKPLLLMFSNLMPEKTLIGQINGVFTRSRPDIMDESGSLIIEYKTTTNAQPAQWGRTTPFTQGYDIQLALGRLALRCVYGAMHSVRCIFLVQEIEEPYACSVIELSPEALDRAETMIHKASRLWYDVVHNNVAPTYSDSGIHILHAPKWDIQP